MSAELAYRSEAAAGYDRAFGHVSKHFAPHLLRATRVAPGMQVLDIASSTGLVAEIKLETVGSTGHIIAADLWPAMVENARQRFRGLENASVAVEDGQALSFSQESFDTVICSLGLMFFPDPQRGLNEFHRVLRCGGGAAVSVNTLADRSYNNFITLTIARYAPSLQAAAVRVFSLGDEGKLRTLFDTAGFSDVEITTEIHRFRLPSFDTYFEPFERGAGSPGQAFVALPSEARKAVREEVRCALGDTGGPIDVEVELKFASGQR